MTQRLKEALARVEALPPARQNHLADVLLTELAHEDASDQLRPFGLCAGHFTVPDDFDAPLPDDVLRTFET